MPARGEDARLRAGTPEDIPFIRRMASAWRLDDETLAPDQLLVAEAGGRIVGFGRIKPYASCFELGTVGVDPDWRGRGLGRRLVAALIERFPCAEVWITTDLTRYFARLGFVEAADPPAELREKMSSTCRVKGRTGVKAMVLRRSRRED